MTALRVTADQARWCRVVGFIGGDPNSERRRDAQHLIVMCNGITDHAFDVAKHWRPMRGRELFARVELVLAFANFRTLSGELDRLVYS